MLKSRRLLEIVLVPRKTFSPWTFPLIKNIAVLAMMQHFFSSNLSIFSCWKYENRKIMYNFPIFFSTFSAGRVECSFGNFADFSLQISDCLRSKSENDETLEVSKTVVLPQNIFSWTGRMQKWQPFKKMS